MIDIVRWLLSQEKAIANAREASTLLCRQRVEREEVALFLQEHAEGWGGSQTA
jgi:hypothetical protein